MNTIDYIKETMKIDEQYLSEMARIGFLKGGSYEIYVRTNDPGFNPHMHIWDSNTRGEDFHTCIRLDKPEYFIHEGKADKLNSKMKKELIKFLGEYDDDEPDKTHWEILLIEWNRNNSSVKVKKDTPMPDYTKL